MTTIPRKRTYRPGDTKPEARWVTLAEAKAANLGGLAWYIKNAIGPREIGGRYKCGYWGETYTVEKIMIRVDLVKAGYDSEVLNLRAVGWETTVRWDGSDKKGTHPRVTQHCTHWDAHRDKIIHGPASEYLTDDVRASILEYVRGNYPERTPRPDASPEEVAEMRRFRLPHCDMAPVFIGDFIPVGYRDHKDFGYTHAIEVQYNSGGARCLVMAKPDGTYAIEAD